jgi:ribosomal protein S18 acetylase RimI-like enzyme
MSQTMNVNVKQAKLSDLNEIAPLFDAYRVFYRQDSNLAIARDFLQQRLQNSESIIFYAIDEAGNYLGFTQLYPIFSSVSVQRTWLLNDLYVDAKARGLGVGTKLLNQAKDYAKLTGAKGVALETEITNVGAQKLYEHLNYEKDKEHFHYFLSV